MSNESILAAELFINDKKAQAVLNDFPKKLKATQDEINKIDDSTNFGNKINKNFDEVERRAGKMRSVLEGAFSPASLVTGAAFGAVIAFLSDATQAALNAEKANRLLASSATEARKSYAELAASNEKFAREAGLSNTAGASTYAKIQQLATATGKPETADALAKSFLDLGAAKGIDAKDLETLISSMLSGQDEGFNKLSLSDPSKLQEIYADKIKKTVEQLTQQEKTQAGVNAVTEKAAVFLGANADKMESLSGKSERAAATLENFKTGVGESITESRIFRDAIGLLDGALGSLTISHVKAREELAKGVTPKELAEKDANTFGAQATAFIQNGATAPFASVFYLYDLATEGVETANKNLIESITGAGERNRKTAEAEYTKDKALTDKQNKAATDQKEANNKKQAETDQKAHAERMAADRARKVERLIAENGSLAELRALQSNLDKKTIGQKPFDEQNDRINDYIKKQIESGKEKVKELEKAATGALESIVTRYGTGVENPFVAVFSASDDALTKLRNNLTGVSVEMRANLTELVDRMNQIDLAKARLDNNLNAFELRDAAANFRDPYDEAKAKSIQDDFTKRFLFDNPNYLFSEKVKFDRERENLLFSNPAFAKFGDLPTFEEKIRKDLAERAAGLIDSPGERLQRKLDEQIRIVNRARGDGSDETLGAIADRKLIALSAALDPTKIASNQREEFASAREREAARLESGERAAREIEMKKLEAINDLKADVNRLANVAEKEGIKGVDVRVINEAGDLAKTSVKRPNSSDTAKQFQQGLATRSGNRLSNY